MKRFRKKKKNDNTTDKMEIAKHTYNYRLQSFIDVERQPLLFFQDSSISSSFCLLVAFCVFYSTIKITILALSSVRRHRYTLEQLSKAIRHLFCQCLYMNIRTPTSYIQHLCVRYSTIFFLLLLYYYYYYYLCCDPVVFVANLSFQNTSPVDNKTCTKHTHKHTQPDTHTNVNFINSIHSRSLPSNSVTLIQTTRLNNITANDKTLTFINTGK